MTGWRGKILLTFLSVLISGLLFGSLAELYTRWTKPYETPATLREKSLEYEATLFARTAFPRMVQNKPRVIRQHKVLVTINERGYRGQSFVVPKPAGLVRVVVLGGSSAFDQNANEGQDWPHLIEVQLHDRGYANVEVINAAMPGHATWDSLGRLYSEIWMFDPDFIIVYHCWNDIKYFSWLSPEQSLLRGYRPKETSANGSNLVDNPFIYYANILDRLLSISQLYVQLRGRYLKWRLGMIGAEGLIRPQTADQRTLNQQVYPDNYGPYGPRQYELNLRLIAAAIRHLSATPIFLTEARLVSSSNSKSDRERIGYFYVNLSHKALVAAFADCDKIMHTVAQAEGIPVLDLAQMFSGHSELFSDQVHTTSMGSQAIAKATSLFLASILDKNF